MCNLPGGFDAQVVQGFVQAALFVMPPGYQCRLRISTTSLVARDLVCMQVPVSLACDPKVPRCREFQSS